MALHPIEIRDGKVSKYLQIVRALKEQIVSGQFKAGERLPSDRKLASKLAVSVTTATAAMNELARMGLIVRQHGSGSYVTKEPLVLTRKIRIGFFGKDPRGVYSRKILSSLWALTEPYNFDLIPVFRETDAIEAAVAEYSMDAVLIHYCTDIPLKLLKSLRQKGVPVLLLSSIMEGCEDFCAGYSNERIVEDAVKYLAGLGHTQIGFLIDMENVIPNSIRLRSFSSAMWKLRLPVNPEWILHSASKVDSVAEYLTRPDRPAALILGNCVYQSHLIKAMKQNNLAAPDDLSVFVIDENYDTVRYPLQFSRFKVNVESFSEQAVSRLLRLLKSEEVPASEFCNYDFVDAATCRRAD